MRSSLLVGGMLLLMMLPSGSTMLQNLTRAKRTRRGITVQNLARAKRTRRDTLYPFSDKCRIHYTEAKNTNYFGGQARGSKSRVDCEILCSFNEYCNAFDYDYNSNKCYIHLNNGRLLPKLKLKTKGVYHYRLSTHKCIGLPYVGCYRDDFPPDLDALPDLDAALISRTEMHNEMCIDKCRALGTKYAGTQYGQVCWCGNSYGKYGKATNCDRRCPGDPKQFCGGNSANSIYKVDENARFVDSQNLALYGKTYQSSTQAGAIADRAVDGNTNPDFSIGSCTHTKMELFAPWWAVDLKHAKNIAFVKLTNRVDCCEKRLHAFWIGLTDKDPSGFTASTFDYKPGNYYECVYERWSLKAGQTWEYECMGKARYVIVQILFTEALTLCEVQVYGEVEKKKHFWNTNVNPDDTQHHHIDASVEKVADNVGDKVGYRITYMVLGGVSAALVLVVIIALLVINVGRKKKDDASKKKGDDKENLGNEKA